MTKVVKVPFVGPVVVTGHRGTALKPALPSQAKDHPDYVNRPPRLKVPTTPRGRLPLIEFKKATDYTRYPSPASLIQAFNALTRVGDPAQLVLQVRNWIDANLPPAGTGVVLIAGEKHLSRASLMLHIAILGALVSKGMSPVQALEVNEDAKRALASKGPEVMRDLQAAQKLPPHQRSAYVGALLDKIYFPDLPRLNYPLMLAIVAGNSKLQVEAFDPFMLEGGHNVTNREDQMVASALGHLNQAKGQPLVLTTGAVHVAALHEKLSEQLAQLGSNTKLIVLSTLQAGATDAVKFPHERSRLSWLHSKGEKGEVLLIKPTLELEQNRFDFIQFANANGLLKPRQAQRPDVGSSGT